MASDAKDALAVIPWYWRDWRASEARATLSRKPLAGWCYRELLDAMWGTPGCDLPDDDAQLAALAAVTDREWRSVRDLVLRFLPLDQATGRRSHPRSQHEHGKALAYRDKCRAGGKKRWEAESQAGATLKPPSSQNVSPPHALSSLSSLLSSPPPGEKNSDTELSPGGDLFGVEPVKADPKPKGPTTLPPLVQVWNRVATELNAPRVDIVGTPRARTMKAALAECSDLDRWERAFRLILADPWLRGQNPNAKRYGDFDFAISPSKRGKWLDLAATPTNERGVAVLTPEQEAADLERRRAYTAEVRSRLGIGTRAQGV